MCRHALKYVPEPTEFASRHRDEGLESDPYAITFFDQKLGKEVTMDWNTYHGNPVQRHPGLPKGTWTGRNTRPPSTKRTDMLHSRPR